MRNKEIPFERVVNAAKLIGMHDFIMRLPGGYDYDVMERGNTLSLGQRQLLSFIRALLFDPSILILDEATSSVDTESEMTDSGGHRQTDRGPHVYRYSSSAFHHPERQIKSWCWIKGRSGKWEPMNS